jgi:hypothetical protein
VLLHVVVLQMLVVKLRLPVVVDGGWMLLSLHW